MPTTAILRLHYSDGTFDLINPEMNPTPVNLDGWQPVAPSYKGGGVFSSSPFSDGRRPVFRVWDNIIDTPNLTIAEQDPDSFALIIQTLRQIFEEAIDYWIGTGVTNPVYIERLAGCETNQGYAVLYQGGAPSDSNYFDQPFLQPGGTPVMEDFSIVLEHGHWLDVAPNSSTSVSMKSEYDDTGVQTAVTTPIHIRNAYAEYKITHLYVDDGGVVGGNLIGSGVPYNLLPATPAVGDALYIGIQSSTYDWFPTNVVFNLSQAFDGQINWDIWDGAAWRSISFATTTDNNDETNSGFPNLGAEPYNSLRNLGRVAVNLQESADLTAWSDGDLNTILGYGPAITAWWIRAIVNTSAGTQPPIQQTEDVYMASWNYLEIDSSDIGGDIPASVEHIVRFLSLARDDTEKASKRVICGLRSTSRGTGFVSSINAVALSAFNATGCAFTLGSRGSTVGDIQSAAISMTRHTPNNTDWQDTGRFTITSNVLPDFYGDYKAFIIATQTTGSTGDLEMRLSHGRNDTVLKIMPSFGLEVVDGNLPTLYEIPEILTITEPLEADTDGYRFLVEIRDSGGSTSLTSLYSLVLIPIDEHSFDVSFNDVDTATAVTPRFRISGLENRKSLRSDAEVYSVLDADILYRGSAVTIMPKKPILQANASQRLWFLGAYHSDLNRVSLHGVMKIDITKQQRYFTMLGDQ